MTGSPYISAEDAIALAKTHAQQQGWMWKGPVSCQRVGSVFVKPVYEIATNTQCIGCNIRISIDASTGKILHAAFAPR